VEDVSTFLRGAVSCTCAIALSAVAVAGPADAVMRRHHQQDHRHETKVAVVHARIPDPGEPVR
jgi:hypothetical protein